MDTNVLVSGLLKRNSKPDQIIDAILNGKIHLVIDERIFKEYYEVLHRPKLNIPLERVDAILSFIAFSSLWIECKPVEFFKNEILDRSDLPFIELAINNLVMLITSNIKHFQHLQKYDIQVFSPDEFLRRYSQII